MLRRELLIGYLVAGVLAVAVPSSVYNVVFVSGHGALTELENVIVGPLVAFISFVCSIGNVPLAAALFKSGLSFGGTIAFTFADLITVPRVVIYGKFFGRRLALRLFFPFWAVMSAASLVTDLLFRAVRIPAPGRPLLGVPVGGLDRVVDVEVRHHGGVPQGRSRPDQVHQEVRGDRVQHPDVPEREGPQKRAQRRRGPDTGEHPAHHPHAARDPCHRCCRLRRPSRPPAPAPSGRC